MLLLYAVAFRLLGHFDCLFSSFYCTVRERERDRARVRVGQQECSIERDKRMAIALFMWPYNIVGSLVGLGEAAGVGPEVGVLGRSGAVQRVF